jgi:hypothetical protein
MLSLDFSKFAVAEVYNQTGFAISGKTSDILDYDVFYAGQKSDGYSVGGRVVPRFVSKIPGLSSYAVFVNDERRASVVSSDSKYKSALYNKFINFGGGLKKSFAFKNGIKDIAFSADAFRSIENRFGSAVLKHDMSRDLVFVPGVVSSDGQTNDLAISKDDLYHVGLEISRIAGLDLHQKIEYKRIGNKYITSNSMEWCRYFGTTIGNKLFIENLQNEQMRAHFYWLDQQGFASETQLSISFIDLFLNYDMGGKVTDADYKYKNIWARAAARLSKLTISYDHENRHEAKAGYAYDSKDMVINEIGLKFLPSSKTLIKAAYSLFNMKNDQIEMYSHQAIYVGLSHRIYSSVVLGASYKKYLDYSIHPSLVGDLNFSPASAINMNLYMTF